MFDLEYSIHKDFSRLPFILKIMYVYLAIGLARVKYYFGWCLSEIKFVASGAYRYTTHKGRNVDIPSIEMAGSPHELLNAWNISTNLWLKDCVYKLLMELKVAQGYAILSTNFVSALWHGFYPGYYLTFIGGGIGTMIHRSWRKLITPGNLESNKIYDYSSKVYMGLLMIFLCGPFMLCDFWYSMTFYMTLKFYGFVMLGVGGCIVYILNKKYVSSTKSISKDKIN